MVGRKSELTNANGIKVLASWGLGADFRCCLPRAWQLYQYQYYWEHRGSRKSEEMN
jgi:hypothetical protein